MITSSISSFDKPEIFHTRHDATIVIAFENNISPELLFQEKVVFLVFISEEQYFGVKQSSFLHLLLAFMMFQIIV